MSIPNRETLDYIKDDLGFNEVWIGFNDLASEGSFEWSDETASSFTNWNSGEPNNVGGEDCGFLKSNGGWNDANCENIYRPGIYGLPFSAYQDVCHTFICYSAIGQAQIAPSQCLSESPTRAPSVSPSTNEPSTAAPSVSPTTSPSVSPTSSPSSAPTASPTDSVTLSPTSSPTSNPSKEPSMICRNTDKMSWGNHEDAAVSLGGQLLSVPDQATHDYIVANLYTANGMWSLSADLWIGLNDRDTNGQFVWSDGSPVQFTNFHDGEPNNGGIFIPAEDCVHYRDDGTGEWNDSQCGWAIGAIYNIPRSEFVNVCHELDCMGWPGEEAIDYSLCPSPTSSPTASPTSSPTDSPTDTPSLSPSTSSPTEIPSVSPTRSPTKAPSVKPFHSPTKAPSVSPTDNPSVSPTTLSPTSSPISETMMCVNSNSISWTNHEAEAVTWGGHLVSIPDASTQAYILNDMGQQTYLIGLNDISQEGTFVWRSGSPVSYTNWFTNEPNSGDGDEDCVIVVAATNGQWFDVNCQYEELGIYDLPLSVYGDVCHLYDCYSGPGKDPIDTSLCPSPTSSPTSSP